MVVESVGFLSGACLAAFKSCSGLDCMWFGHTKSAHRDTLETAVFCIIQRISAVHLRSVYCFPPLIVANSRMGSLLACCAEICDPFWHIVCNNGKAFRLYLP